MKKKYKLKFYRLREEGRMETGNIRTKNGIKECALENVEDYYNGHMERKR